MFLFLRLLFFLQRGQERGKGRETSMCGCLSRTPALGTWPATQAHALTGNQTSNPLVRRPALIHWATPAREQPLFLKSVLFGISIGTHTFFFHFHKISFPFPYFQSVCVFQSETSCRQLTYGSCFLTHSATLCLLIGAFNLFTFKVIVNRYVVLEILLFIFIFLFFLSPFSISCNTGLVMNSFSFVLSGKLSVLLNDSFAGQSHLGDRSLPTQSSSRHLARVLSTPAACLHPSYWSEWMFLL